MEDYEVVNYVTTITVKPFLNVFIQTESKEVIFMEDECKGLISIKSNTQDPILVCSHLGTTSLLENPLENLDKWTYTVNEKEIKSIDKLEYNNNDTVYIQLLNVLVDNIIEKTIIVRSWDIDMYQSIVYEIAEEYFKKSDEESKNVNEPVQNKISQCSIEDSKKSDETKYNVTSNTISLQPENSSDKKSIFNTICNFLYKIVNSMNCLKSVDTK